MAGELDLKEEMHTCKVRHAWCRVLFCKNYTYLIISNFIDTYIYICSAISSNCLEAASTVCVVVWMQRGSNEVIIRVAEMRSGVCSEKVHKRLAIYLYTGMEEYC